MLKEIQLQLKSSQVGLGEKNPKQWSGPKIKTLERRQRAKEKSPPMAGRLRVEPQSAGSGQGRKVDAQAAKGRCGGHQRQQGDADAYQSSAIRQRGHFEPDPRQR